METHRRGTETARTICAVSDGAAWIQVVVALHRPDAGRILDCPHALSEVAQAGQAMYGEDTPAFSQWFTRQRHTLQYGDAGEVLQALRQLVARGKRRGASPALATGHESLGYLETRRSRLDDAWFQARGYPIGSGCVESWNKLVVERRLKGAGMHWAQTPVNPMVARHTVACSARWAEAWPQLVHHRHHHLWPRRMQPQQATRAASPPLVGSSLPAQPPAPCAPMPTAEAKHAAQPTPSARPALPHPPKALCRPPPNHPWRRFRSGRARCKRPAAACIAKL